MPATGNTCGGSASSRATSAAWLRSSLSGQQPRPTACTARMKFDITSAQSTLALKKLSRWSLAKGLPRISQIRRMRRLSPHQTRNTGAVAIHGEPANRASISARSAGSSMRITHACCRSDFAGAVKAQASAVSSTASSTGRSA